MSDLLPEMKPLTALGADTPRTDTHGPITLVEMANTAIASFACRLDRETQARMDLGAFLSTDLPQPGRMIEAKGFRTFWTGPDQWMITAPHDTHEDLAAQIRSVAGDAASVTEQNDAWCQFDLAGSGLADVFERLCPINMRAIKGGEATRTSIDHLGCFVLVRSPTEITVLGPRSSAGSLHHALLTAMKSAH